MGTSHSVDGFLKKLGEMSTATERQRTTAVAQGAAATKAVMLSAAAAKGVSPGGKIANRPWGVSYKVKGGLEPGALVRFTGPFHLVNNPTSPHYVAAKGLGGNRATRGVAAFQASVAGFTSGSGRGAFSGLRRSRGKRALSFRGVARPYVFHPGTSGKGILADAKTLARRSVPPVMAKSMSSAWKRVMA